MNLSLFDFMLIGAFVGMLVVLGNLYFPSATPSRNSKFMLWCKQRHSIVAITLLMGVGLAVQHQDSKLTMIIYSIGMVVVWVGHLTATLPSRGED
ncbi:MAG: hypothetical protein LWW76_07165 [Burkholderiales bacterium]|nr:hypothetical protein [Burkholderiales bacterium]